MKFGKLYKYTGFLGATVRLHGNWEKPLVYLGPASTKIQPMLVCHKFLLSNGKIKLINAAILSQFSEIK